MGRAELRSSSGSAQRCPHTSGAALGQERPCAIGKALQNLYRAQQPVQQDFPMDFSIWAVIWRDRWNNSDHSLLGQQLLGRCDLTKTFFRSALGIFSESLTSPKLPQHPSHPSSSHLQTPEPVSPAQVKCHQSHLRADNSTRTGEERSLEESKSSKSCWKKGELKEKLKGSH